jgi:hypothetical protein
VKGFIEKNTWVGLEEFYKALVQAMQQELSLVPIQRGRRPKRQGSIQQQVQQPVITVARQSLVDDTPQLVTNNSRHIFTMDDRKSHTNSNSSSKLSWIVIILLLGLLIFNVILYVKLWKMEDRSENIPDLSAMK